MTALYIGLMSGTSMDGVDAVLVDFSQSQPLLVASHTQAMPEQLFQGLQQLCQPANNEINHLGQLDRAVGQLFAKAVNALLDKAKLSPEQILAIGSHGQTIRHMPTLDAGFTLQIGDPNTIAVNTHIDVIADFRRKDIALGGQGAPLVPAFHQQVFAQADKTRVILNIGGIANITFLPGDSHKVLGFDTGPGNTLMDYWTRLHQNMPYDNKGQWAASGHTNHVLLAQMLSEPYFAQDFPKSTGRELFNQAWLENQLASFSQLSAEDVQSTLLDLTCQSIVRDILALSNSGEVFTCGGGALNQELMRRLALLLPAYQISSTADLGVDPKWVEAIAFAWLAMRFNTRLPANLPAVTGASREAILGALYPAA